MLNGKGPASRRISPASTAGARRAVAPHTCGGDRMVLGTEVSALGGKAGKGGHQPRRNSGGVARCARPSPAWLRANHPQQPRDARGGEQCPTPASITPTVPEHLPIEKLKKTHLSLR